ncbi:MAG TPA: carboxylesterase family protein [Steroidobacteraceae bacterium]|jgi:para-nitrobenzyl esterase|nr:carboxylesterase family protein [Steroidobacteraceae bacterium]
MSTPRFVARAAALVLVVAGAAAFSQAQKAGAPDAAAPAALNGPVIKVRQGEAQGAVADGVVVFKGLPFAAPPVGDLRWRAPQPAAKWSGVRAANAFSSGCAQSEDCLYLNVYEPADAKKGAHLPVMVWIHGGAFLFGSGSAYDGSQFARQGVVVVTVNYRLGRAGWFAHPALTAENPKGPLGNYGLMDQVAALDWVQDNIKAFGGDPKNVTIFGESAGAISVNYLMLAPQAKGLFEKALSESGFGRLPARPISSVEQNGLNFAEKAGVQGSDAAAAKALRALPWSTLTGNVAGIGAAEQILPMADGKMITGSAADGFAKGIEAHVPYLLGGNSDEASLTRRGLNAAERLASIQARRDAFIAAYDPDGTGDADRIIARLVTDSSISEPDRDLARLHAQHGNATYVYNFSYTPAAQRATLFGLAHGGELPYVFDVPRATPFDDEGKAIAVAANGYWARFAKTGDPDSAGGATWPKFDSADEYVMEFPASGIPATAKHFHKDRLDWVEAGLGK